jgi:hypothetical protein
VLRLSNIGLTGSLDGQSRIFGGLAIPPTFLGAPVSSPALASLTSVPNFGMTGRVGEAAFVEARESRLGSPWNVGVVTAGFSQETFAGVNFGTSDLHGDWSALAGIRDVGVDLGALNWDAVLGHTATQLYECKQTPSQAALRRVLQLRFDWEERPWALLVKNEVSGGRDWIVGALQRAGWNVSHPFDDRRLYMKSYATGRRREQPELAAECFPRTRAPCSETKSRRYLRVCALPLRSRQRQGARHRWRWTCSNTRYCCSVRDGCAIPSLSQA